MESRHRFYEEAVARCLKRRDASILVVAGDRADREVFHKLGFTNVVISNVDSRIKPDQFAPYRWSFEDARSLSLGDGEFDYVVVHDGLHHCSSPHQALLEMYRVARVGVLAIEARDSLIMRCALRLGLTQAYGHAAVFYNQCKFGGVNNTQIPNYVYRWTESEIEKTVKAFAPHARHRFVYLYGSAMPELWRLKSAFLKRALAAVLLPVYRLLAWLAPKQQNLFAFYIAKPVVPDDLHPWLSLSDSEIRFDREWAAKVYRKNL